MTVEAHMTIERVDEPTPCPACEVPADRKAIIQPGGTELVYLECEADCPVRVFEAEEGSQNER